MISGLLEEIPCLMVKSPVLVAPHENPIENQFLPLMYHKQRYIYIYIIIHVYAYVNMYIYIYIVM